MLTPTTTPPHTITPEEHSTITSSTPTSFVDIPPVLRWLDQVEVYMSPVSGGWEAWTGRIGGRLYVTEAAVTFIPDGNASASGTTNAQIQGFNLPYQALTLHALTPADSSTQTPAHLYCQVDESDAPSPLTTTAGNTNGNGNSVVDNEEDGEGEGEGNGEDEFTEMREVRIFLPEAKLEPLFQALSSCSALHASLLPNGEPSSFFGFGDGDDDDDEGEYDDGQWEDADEDSTDGGRVRTHNNGQNGPSARFRPY
ncbi:chloride channel, nucleotide-sensitive, 1A [Kwoniella heveanensis CBS 569]|nr:chloride channel, nucleotide-sensitive, 1A [Kwoniella heveanensis CBS 569]